MCTAEGVLKLNKSGGEEMRTFSKAFVRSFLLLVLFVVAMGIFVVLNGCDGTDDATGAKGCKKDSDCKGTCQLCVRDFCGPCQRRVGWSCNPSSGKCDIVAVKQKAG